METIRVGVVGATGKMGREILKAVTNDPATEVISAWVLSTNRQPSL